MFNSNLLFFPFWDYGISMFTLNEMTRKKLVYHFNSKLLLFHFRFAGDHCIGMLSRYNAKT